MAGITEPQGDVTAVGPGVATSTVEGLQGNPVDAAAPATNNLLLWDGAQWTPAAAAGGGGPQTAFDVDFTVEAPVDIKAGGDGVYTFGGVDFTAVGTGNAAVWDVNVSAPGTGMNMKNSGLLGTCSLVKTMASMALDPRSDQLVMLSLLQGTHVMRVDSLPWYGQWPDITSVDSLKAAFPQNLAGTPTAQQTIVTLFANAKSTVNTPQDGVWSITNQAGDPNCNLFQIPRVALYYV